MTPADLEREVAVTIDAEIENGRTARASWVTHEVVAKHHAAVEISDFDRICAYGYVRTLVRQSLRRFKTQEESDPQSVLPGFERLQKRYLVERPSENDEGEGAQVVVPLELMTDEEIVAKAQELRGMAEGCQLHAYELLRYLGARTHAASVAKDTP